MKCDARNLLMCISREQMLRPEHHKQARAAFRALELLLQGAQPDDILHTLKSLPSFLLSSSPSYMPYVEFKLDGEVLTMQQINSNARAELNLWEVRMIMEETSPYTGQPFKYPWWVLEQEREAHARRMAERFGI